MTPNQITTLIASNLDRELDMPFKKQLMARVKYWRSGLMKNTLNKDPRQRQYFRQRLTVTLEKVNVLENPLCLYIATSDVIPKPIRANGILFDYAGARDGSNGFTYAQTGMLQYLKSGKYSRALDFYNYEDNKISASNKEVRKMLVIGVFDDPEQVADYQNACGESCDFWEEEFPVSDDILQQIVQYILQVDYNRPERQPGDDQQIQSKP
jgi:hypothetical protein